MILVIETHKSGWWLGELRSRVGYFPAGYCVFLSGVPCCPTENEDETTKEKRTSFVRTSLNFPGGDGFFLYLEEAMEKERRREEQEEREKDRGTESEYEESTGWGVTDDEDDSSDDEGEGEEDEEGDVQDFLEGTRRMRLGGVLSCHTQSFANFTVRRIRVSAT